MGYNSSFNCSMLIKYNDCIVKSCQIYLWVILTCISNCPRTAQIQIIVNMFYMSCWRSMFTRIKDLTSCHFRPFAIWSTRIYKSSTALQILQSQGPLKTCPPIVICDSVLPLGIPGLWHRQCFQRILSWYSGWISLSLLACLIFASLCDVYWMVPWHISPTWYSLSVAV